MALSTANILQKVETYQKSALAQLENTNCFIDSFNTKFKNFQNLTANLGDSVNIKLPSRQVANNGLVATFTGIEQRAHSIVCDQAGNVANEVTNQDELFTLDAGEYMDEIGNSAIGELGATVEGGLALNATSAVPVMSVVNGASVPTGALHTESGPTRFYGDGSTAIDSYQQLQQMIINFRNTGMPSNNIKVYLPDTYVPAIVGGGFDSFITERNNEAMQSWDIGPFGSPPVQYYQSNLLPIHIAGNIGNGSSTAHQTLTVVSVDDATGKDVTQITCSCHADFTSDADAIKSGDMCQFIDNTSYPLMRALTEKGHFKSAQGVQFRVTADAAASAGDVVVLTLTKGTNGLVSASTINQNINNTIVAGMTILVQPSHQSGLVIADNAGFCCMPKLGAQSPYVSHAEYDTDTGVSMRMTYGAVLGQNQSGIIHDCIWGSTVVPEYSMRMLFPLS